MITVCEPWKALASGPKGRVLRAALLAAYTRFFLETLKGHRQSNCWPPYDEEASAKWRWRGAGSAGSMARLAVATDGRAEAGAGGGRGHDAAGCWFLHVLLAWPDTVAFDPETRFKHRAPSNILLAFHRPVALFHRI